MPEGALQQKIQAARRTREAGQTVKVPIPGYQNMLIGVYELMDWQARVAIKLRAEEKRTQEAPELLRDIAAEYLLGASKTTEAVDGEERLDLNLPLGVGLASWLGLNEPTESGPLVAYDEEALSLIIPDGEDLIDHFEEMLSAQAKAAAGVDQELVGESVAAG